MKIAVDAMGGDYTPEEIVKGAVIWSGGKVVYYSFQAL